MNFIEYKKLYDSLNSIEDLKGIQNVLEEELLLVLLTQKMVRNTKTKFHKVKAGAQKLVARWKAGETFTEIAKKLSFSPIMTARIILTELGYNRKQLNISLTEPFTVDDEKIKKELIEALHADPVFSPVGMTIQKDRGKRGEAKLTEWLKGKGIKFVTEAEQKGINAKTPDFLFDKETNILGKPVKWIESKASFGDHIEINMNYKKQLSHYVNMFGPGIVVYWFGHLPHDLKDIHIMHGKPFGGIEPPEKGFFEKVNSKKA